MIRTFDNIGSPLDIPIGSRFRINDLTLAVTDKVNSGVYRAEAEIAGILGNQYQGDLLPIQNINNLGRAELGEVLLEGADAEKDDSLRDRYYDHVRRSPFGGNVADYEEKTLAIEGVGSVKVFPIWDGPGSVLLMIGNADGRTASAELIKKVQDLFQPAEDPTGGLAPIGHDVTVSTSKDKVIDITASLRIKPGESFELLKQKRLPRLRGMWSLYRLMSQRSFKAA